MHTNEIEELPLEETIQDIITDGEIYFTISFWNDLSKNEKQG
jgi:hypothetical protein